MAAAEPLKRAQRQCAAMLSHGRRSRPYGLPPCPPSHPTLATAAEAPVNILFVGNSFTHGRHEPVRTYNAGFGNDTVHDLLIEGSGWDVGRARRPRWVLAGTARALSRARLTASMSWCRSPSMRPAVLLKAVSADLNRGRSEATEFALDETGECNRGPVLQVTADDLNADWQTTLGAADRGGRRRQAVQCRDAGPYALVVVGHLGAVDVELTGELRRVIVREGYGRHRWTQHDIDVVEQRQPAAPQCPAYTALADPLRMTHREAAQAEGCEALIVGGEGFDGGLDPLARPGRQISAEKGREQLAINSAGLRQVRQSG